MPEYVCIDGPLDGERLGTSDAHDAGEVIEIEVVDVVQSDVPRFAYEVETAATYRRPGRLRHLPLAG